MIDLYPFSGYTVVVLGLGSTGILASRTLKTSGATVWAWDDCPQNRKRAAEQDVSITDLEKVDWHEPITMVIEQEIPHGKKKAHPFVDIAREMRCEVISDIELLARVQRESAYIGVTGHHDRRFATDVLGYVMEICGREIEVMGLNNKEALNLYPIGSEGAYILDMPATIIDLTVSITFEVAIWLGFNNEAINSGLCAEEEFKAMSWIFHRQTSPKVAIICIDDAKSNQMYKTLVDSGQQVVLAVSSQSKVLGGIGVENGWLIDDRESSAINVINLNNTEAFKADNTKLAAVMTYGCGVSIGLQPHAVMASLNSYAV